ncbi:MAG TPA: tetrahydrofolate dehydrogenase/cyclohydrolase catalytic domain-containing protein, partial [Ignavibacteria bacterium]|nr:tetrahydrofolate dehydrogenase/cyclohydrolase catalytic domain-containing protein [Ignavibacteria bacterium]
MDSKIIDGKAVSEEIISEIKSELSANKVTPGLALVLVGNNPASEIYVKMKEKKCAELGYHSVVNRQPENISEAELLSIISEYN